MNDGWYPSFFDEMTKISTVDLNKGEKRRQALQFAGLGMAAAPVVSGIKNFISHGKLSPWTSKRRWLASSLVGGALAGGALPAAQHLMAQRNVGKARSRAEADRDIQRLAPGGVRRALRAAQRTGVGV